MTRKQKIYISGRMAGVKVATWRRQFGEAERRLRALGWRTVNPARGLPPIIFYVFGRRLALIYDLWLVSRCSAIYMLPGWQLSEGAKLERLNAQARHLRVIDARYCPEPVPEETTNKTN